MTLEDNLTKSGFSTHAGACLRADVHTGRMISQQCVWNPREVVVLVAGQREYHCHALTYSPRVGGYMSSVHQIDRAENTEREGEREKNRLRHCCRVEGRAERLIT